MTSGAGIFFLQTESAAQVNWTGGGDGTQWSTPLNWSGSVVPGSVDAAVFGTTGASSQIGLTANQSVGKITLTADSTISRIIGSSGGSAVTLSLAGNGGLLLENLSATQSLTLAPMVTGGTQPMSVSLAAGTIHTLAGGINVGADMSGAAFTKTGAGTLTLTGTNSYTGTLTISAGSVQIGDGGSTGTPGNANIAISSGTSLIFNRSGSVSTGFSLSGSGTLVQAGGGTTTLSGSSSFSGPVNITAGTLHLGNSGSIGTGAIAISTGSTLQVTRDASTYFLGNLLSGNGDLVKTGNGLVVLTSASPFTGTTTVQAGTLAVGATGGTHSLIGGGSIILQSGTTLEQWPINGSYTMSNTISGDGGVSLTSGGNTATLSGANSYTGATRINTGVLAVSSLGNGGSPSGIGAASSAATNLVLSGGTFRYTGTATSTDRLFSVGTAGGFLDASGTGAVEFTNTGSMGFNGQTGARTLILTGSSTAANSLSPVIGDNSGATTLSKRGTGTWALGGANTYTGATSLINGGTLVISKLADGGVASSLGAAGAGAANLTISDASTVRYAGSGDSTNRLFAIGSGGGTLDASGSGAVHFTSAGTIGDGGTTVARTFTLGGSNTADNTLAAVFANNGSTNLLAKTGAGKWVLTGNHTYTGTTTISGGTLQFGAGGTSGAPGAGNISNNGSLIFDRADAITLAQIVAGSGSLTQAGAGITTLTGTNTYTGATTISAGTLQLGNGGTTGSLATSSITNDGTLVVNRSNAVTWSTPVSGSGGFTQAGAGTTTLAVSPGYSGLTTVSAGKLQSSVSLAMPTSSFTVATGATLATNGTSTWIIAGLNGAGTFENGAASGNTVVTVHGAGTFTGLVRNGATAALSIVKTGTGTQSLDNANTFTGSVAITGGVLSTSSLAHGGTASGIGSASSAATNLVLNGGTLRYTGSGASSDRRFELGANGGSLDASGSGALNLTATDNLSFNGPSGGARTLTLDGTSSASNILAARIIDSDSPTAVVKNGSGTWALTNSNTFSGGTLLNDGVLRISSSNAIGTGSVTFAGGSLEATQSMSISNSLVVNDASNGVTVSAGVLTINGAISGSFALHKDGPGTLIIAGGSNAVPTIVNNGTVQGSATNAGTSIALSTPAAMFEFNQSTSGTYGGIISGPGGIALTGSGGLTLTGANSFDGDTIVSGGVLTVLTNAALGSTSGGVAVQSGGTVELKDGVAIGTETIQLNGSGASGQSGALVSTTGTNSYAGSVIAATNASIAALPGSTLNLSGGLVKNGTVATLTGGGAITISGAGISGASPNSDLVVDGSGTTVTLNTSNSYNGPTFIQNSGTLVLGISHALPTSPRTDLNLNTDGVFNFNGQSDTVASLTGDATGTVRNASIGSTSTFEIATAGGSSTFSGTITGTNGGAQGDVSLTKSGSGTQILDGANTYSGGTTITGGTLQIGSGGSTGQIGAGGITNNAELKIQRSGTVTLSQAITGSGSLAQSGASTTIVTGDNTYSGGTTITGGTLRVGNGGLTGTLGSGSITNDSQLEIQRSNDITLGQAITGTGALTQSGPGNTTLSSNANTYSGGTIISNGTLVASNTTPGTSATGSGTVTVQNSARLAGTGRLAGDVTFQTGSKLLIGNLLSDSQGQDIEFAGGLASTGAFEARFDLFSNFGTGTLNSSLAADQILISGSDRLIDLDIHLVLSDPTTLLNWAAGDSWQIWTWGGISGGNRSLSIASLTAPPLPGGLYWNTSQLNTNGIISVAFVPEPNRVALLMTGLLTILMRRKRTVC